jgi:hypothetical protein
MDILEYLPQHRIVLCKLCKSAIHPSALPKHCQKAHGRCHSTLSSNRTNELFEKETLPALLEQSLLDPQVESLPLPQTECEPFVHLRVEDGFGCNYCNDRSNAGRARRAARSLLRYSTLERDALLEVATSDRVAFPVSHRPPCEALLAVGNATRS